MTKPEQVDRFGCEVAKVGTHDSWIRKTARKVDLDRDEELVRDLDVIFRYYLNSMPWAAIAHQNIHTPTMYNDGRDPEPLSMMVLPNPTKGPLVTLVNPQIIGYEKRIVFSFEACGTLDTTWYCVPRFARVRVKAHEFRDGELTGPVQYVYGELALPDNDRYTALCYFWHEKDHLLGITPDQRTNLSISENEYARNLSRGKQLHLIRELTGIEGFVADFAVPEPDHDLSYGHVFEFPTK